MTKQKLVVVGNGMAGIRAVEELLKLAPDLYDITVFGAEPHGNYNRILLSPVLAGEMTLADIVLNDLDWYRDNGITLHTGKKVVKIDRIARKVVADDGTEAAYHRDVDQSHQADQNLREHDRKRQPPDLTAAGVGDAAYAAKKPDGGGSRQARARKSRRHFGVGGLDQRIDELEVT